MVVNSGSTVVVNSDSAVAVTNHKSYKLSRSLKQQEHVAKLTDHVVLNKGS